MQRITKTQALVAQIIQANTEINGLRVALSNRALASLKEMMVLRKENHDLESTVLQFQVSQTASKIKDLTDKHELPDKLFTLAEDEDGWFLELIPDEH